jgi:hypothetical protein
VTEREQIEGKMSLKPGYVHVQIIHHAGQAEKKKIADALATMSALKMLKHILRDLPYSAKDPMVRPALYVLIMHSSVFWRFTAPRLVH